MTDLVLLVQRRIKYLWTLKRFLKSIVKIFMGINMKNTQKLLLAVNA